MNPLQTQRGCLCVIEYRILNDGSRSWLQLVAAARPTESALKRKSVSRARATFERTFHFKRVSISRQRFQNLISNKNPRVLTKGKSCARLRAERFLFLFSYFNFKYSNQTVSLIIHRNGKTIRRNFGKRLTCPRRKKKDDDARIPRREELRIPRRREIESSGAGPSLGKRTQ